jgi:hypothetical protein
MELQIKLQQVIKDMWDQPQKEYLIMYHPDGNFLYKVITFDNLLRVLNIPSNGQQLYCQPAVVFACLGGSQGALNYDKTLTSSDGLGHSILNVKKIKLGMYQEYFVKNGNIQIRTKLPDMITPQSISEFQFEPILLKRPPQLRRIIKEYYELIGETFDEKLLCQRLDDLMTDNINYTYEDADELVLRLSPQGTEFERLPRELIDIIISCLDDINYFKVEELYKKNNPVLNLMEEITSAVLEEKKTKNDASIFDILNKLQDTGSQSKINELVKNVQSREFFESVMSGVGFKNIVDVINNKVNDQ